MTGRRSAALSSETAGGRITRAWDGQRLCAEVSVHHGACARGIRSSAPSRLIAGTWRGFDGASRSRRPSQGDSRPGLLGLRVDPGGRERLGRSARRGLTSGSIALDSAELVEDNTRPFGRARPIRRAGPVVPGIEYAVSDGNLAAGPFGLRAPAGPGRAAAVVSVQDRFDVEGVMAPHGPAYG